MSTSESDSENDLLHNQQELLRSIATSLRGIHSSLAQLTGAVEGVAEAIETAHEPEGDLGVHLVTALKDISSALHKRAAQERVPQPPQRQQPPQKPQQNRRDDRPPLRLELRSDHRDQPNRYAQEENNYHDQQQISESAEETPFSESHEKTPHDSTIASVQPTPQQPLEERPRKPRPNRNRRGGRGVKPQGANKVPSEAVTPANGDTTAS